MVPTASFDPPPVVSVEWECGYLAAARATLSPRDGLPIDGFSQKYPEGSKAAQDFLAGMFAYCHDMDIAAGIRF